MSFETLFLFLATTFVVVLSPGPAAIAVSAEAASAGAKKSFAVVLGIAAANVVFFVLSGTGIAALILASYELFTVIKWVGVLYLLYLGVCALFSTSGIFRIGADSSKNRCKRKAFLHGFVLELSNPKALIYFSALLPQFIDPDQSLFNQLALLCALTFLLDLLCYSFYSYLGLRASRSGLGPGVIKLINRCAGVFLIMTGTKMASFER